MKKNRNLFGKDVVGRLPNEFFERYRIGELVGEGGFSKVFFFFFFFFLDFFLFCFVLFFLFFNSLLLSFLLYLFLSRLFLLEMMVVVLTLQEK